MSIYHDGCAVRVWRPEETKAVLYETEIGSVHDIETEIVEVIANNTTEVLRVPFSEKDLVKRLLASGLEENIKVILEDYLHSQLEIIGKTINKTFSIDESVCYDYSTHAKFNNHIKAIIEKFSLKVFGEDDLNPTNTIRGKNIEGANLDEIFAITEVDPKQGDQDHGCHIEPEDIG